MGAPNLTRADARRRAELLDVTAYEVELDLTDGRGKPGPRARSQNRQPLFEEEAAQPFRKAEAAPGAAV